jgi:hypothetical protein
LYPLEARLSDGFVQALSRVAGADVIVQARSPARSGSARTALPVTAPRTPHRRGRRGRSRLGGAARSLPWPGACGASAVLVSGGCRGCSTGTPAAGSRGGTASRAGCATCPTVRVEAAFEGPPPRWRRWSVGSGGPGSASVTHLENKRNPQKPAVLRNPLTTGRFGLVPARTRGRRRVRRSRHGVPMDGAAHHAPWCIDEVFLFEAARLEADCVPAGRRRHRHQRPRGAVDRGAGAPDSNNPALVLDERQKGCCGCSRRRPCPGENRCWALGLRPRVLGAGLLLEVCHGQPVRRGRVFLSRSASAAGGSP